MAAFCRVLGIAVYLAGAVYGVRRGSGIQKVGESGVAYAFLLSEAAPIWAAALIFGTILLALGVILFRFGQSEEPGGEEPQN